MKCISYLVAMPTETKITQRFFLLIAMQPVCNDALIRAAELARTCQDATPVDPNWKIKSASKNL